jgi:hypothetical protein
MRAINQVRGGTSRYWTIATIFMALAFIFVQPGSAQGQWATNGNDISNTNTGKVGIGTATPSLGKLEIASDDGVAAGEHPLLYASRSGQGSGGVKFGYRTDGTQVVGGFIRSLSNLPFFVGTTATPQALTISDDGRFGVGTINPQVSFHVSTASTNTSARGIINEQTSNDGNAALLMLRKSRAGGAVLNGDFIGNVYADAFDGTNFVSGGRMRFAIDGPVTTGNVPTAIQFLTGSNSTGIERMRINSSGNVGIGTTNPEVGLHVSTASINTGARGIIDEQTSNDANGALMILRKSRAGGAVVNGDNIGNVYPMAFDGATFVSGSRIRFAVDGAVTAGNIPTTIQFLTGSNNTGVERMRVTSNGNVGIGTTTPTATLDVNGNINVSGNINAKYQDVAEWVPASHVMPAGTVVVLDPEKSNQVMSSTKAYDTAVAGVVSAQPGIALGERGEGKVLVATTGRVKVRVDATQEGIKVGDLLVTGEHEGVAMKSVPMMINGRAFHSPGTLIGKALEPMEKGKTGEILVLLSLQ